MYNIRLMRIDLIRLDGCMIPLPFDGRISPEGIGRLFDN